MARLIRRGSLAVATTLATTTILLACNRDKRAPTIDASVVADASDAALDAAALPETEVVYLEAGVDPNGRRVPHFAGNAAPSVSPLPRPCNDKTLGTVVFAEDGDKVTITSSKGIARASCVRLDEHKLLCDWVDKDGTPTLTRRAVTYGAKTKIGGSYDAKHTFACPAQDDTPKPPPPRPPVKKPRR